MGMCLGSLARWGSALVRRGSRVRIPPEAFFFKKRVQIWASRRIREIVAVDKLDIKFEARASYDEKPDNALDSKGCRCVRICG